MSRSMVVMQTTCTLRGVHVIFCFNAQLIQTDCCTCYPSIVGISISMAL